MDRFTYLQSVAKNPPKEESVCRYCHDCPNLTMRADKNGKTLLACSAVENLEDEEPEFLKNIFECPINK